MLYFHRVGAQTSCGGCVDRVDRAAQHDIEHLPIAVAAAQTYFQVVGETPKQKSIAHLDRILNNVAHAITNIAPVYIPDGPSQRQIEPIELLESSFRRGATVLTLKDGTELRGITVRRIDVREAVTVLKAVKARFDDGGDS
jgi:hypothetical protein